MESNTAGVEELVRVRAYYLWLNERMAGVDASASPEAYWMTAEAIERELIKEEEAAE